MQIPFIVVCFKSEPLAFGKNAVRLAKICQTASKKHGVDVAISPNALDLRMIAERFSVPVFAQHFHPVDMGKHTGHLPAEGVKLAGANGVIINHAEKPLHAEAIRERIRSAKLHGLTSIVCCKSPDEASTFASMGPDFVSYEPPEFIGSTSQSVSTAKPEILKRAVTAVNKANPSVKTICGAGVASKDDVRIALGLGARGFMISTAIVKADEPMHVLDGFCESIKKHIEA